MNKILLSLLILSIIGTTSALNAYYFNAKYWESCKEATTQYSLWLDNRNNSSKFDSASYLFTCAQAWFTDSSRQLCEKKFNIYGQDQQVQNYYLNCVVPDFKFMHSHASIVDKCGAEMDQCNQCIQDENCKTFMNGTNGKQEEYSLSGEPEQCAELKNNCNENELKNLAYFSCSNFYRAKCLQAWLDNNAKDDMCYSQVVCNPQVSLDDLLPQQYSF